MSTENISTWAREEYTDEIDCEECESRCCDGPSEWDVHAHQNYCAPGSNQYECMQFRLIKRLRQQAVEDAHTVMIVSSYQQWERK